MRALLHPKSYPLRPRPDEFVDPLSFQVRPRLSTILTRRACAATTGSGQATMASTRRITGHMTGTTRARTTRKTTPRTQRTRRHIWATMSLSIHGVAVMPRAEGGRAGPFRATTLGRTRKMRGDRAPATSVCVRPVFSCSLVGLRATLVLLACVRAVFSRLYVALYSRSSSGWGRSVLETSFLLSHEVCKSVQCAPLWSWLCAARRKQ